MFTKGIQVSFRKIGYEVLRRPKFSLEFLSRPPFTEGLNPQQSCLIRAYLKDIHKIQGWVTAPAVKLMTLVHLFQNLRQIRGSVAEIGVLHGKSFLPLYILCASDSTAVAVDIFVAHPAKAAEAARDDYASFIRHLKTYGGEDRRKLRVIKADSFLIDADRIKKETQGGGVRIFSIDGAHTVAATLRDLQNARKCLVWGGVIMIDDYFQPTWPGVSEALNLFLREEGYDLRPIFIGFNKILLTDNDHAETYRQFIEKGMGTPLRRSIFFESDVLVYG